MNVVFFWEKAGLSWDKANPYAALLARALEKIGVRLEAGFALEREWLDANRGRVAILHLNWPQIFYRGEDGFEAWHGRFTRFVEGLYHARHLGYGIVWTLHNLYPHEQPFPEIDRIGRLIVADLADAVIGHCDHALDLARAEFHRTDRTYVIPHGNFIDAYPNEILRVEARSQLGIGEGQFVYLFVGNLRQYKGVETLLDTFERLPGDDVTLLLATRARDEYGHSVLARARAMRRTSVHTSEMFPNEAFQVFLNAADVVALPFVDMLTSGSAILALSFGRPVLIPAIGCLPELLRDGGGILYDPHQADALLHAMTAARGLDLPAAGRRASEVARSLDWDPIAVQTKRVYEEVLARR
jgi:glycosyltransferase involved in cell wall biosynthesis